MIAKDHKILKFLTVFFFGFIASNVLYVDYLIFKDKTYTKLFQIASQTYDEGSRPTSVCEGKECLDKIYQTIYEATASLKLSNQTETQKTPVASGGTAVKEYFITFGSGSSAADDWADVTGLSAYVDSTQYGRIKSVTFEASVFIPTGNERAYVRLFNATDKHPVWFSEVSLEGGQSQLLISQPITLDPGNKLYQVQMKTSLKYQANLAQSRLRISVY